MSNKKKTEGSPNFNLPKEGTAERCYDEYEEHVDDKSKQLVRTGVDETKEESHPDHKVATKEGLDFTKSLSKLNVKDFVDNVKTKIVYDGDGRRKVIMRAPKTAWIHNLIHLNGEKFDFTGREYLLPIYNTNDKEILLKTARQVEKSTLLANELTVMAALIPFFRNMYVSPSHVQTRTFSNDKLKPVLERSPMIARYLQDNKVSTQVFEKGFTNGSMTFLRSAFFSADRARGISSDLLCVDELQDMIMDNLPVIAQCLSHSKYQYHRYAGTPKSFDNTIEQYWQQTTQNEWMVPCSGCSSATGKKWNFLDMKNIGKNGPICKFCGKRLEISDGQWQSTVKGKRMRGYRIPQLMVPWIREWGGEPWKTLVHEMEIYPEAQFYNEILGLSYDNAAKPVTRADIAMNCSSSCHFLDLNKPIPDKYSRGILFAGVDWGEGNDGTGKDIMGKKRNASYTILTIGGMVGQKFQVVFMKKYMGKEADPDFVVTDIFNICKRLNVRMIGVDWGHGWGVNNRLFRMYGAEKCVQFMYVDNQKEVRKWDPVGYKFQLMRNHVMSEVFFMFKEGKFLFPPIAEWEWYLQDIMNISVEYIEYQRKLRYIHRPSDPDDCFHSLLYCKQVADVYYGKR